MNVVSGQEPDDIEDSPANETIWVFILGDMCVFSIFFFMYLYYRSANLELYQQSQAMLNAHYGSINTLLLLTSSWFVVMALALLRKGDTVRCSRFTLGAIGFGSLFAVSKLMEYGEKTASGISFETNDFFVFYYLMTGIHFAHLLTGLAVLVYLYFSINKLGTPTKDQINTYELSGIFWHMVDLLWILIFPLLYLLP